MGSPCSNAYAFTAVSQYGKITAAKITELATAVSEERVRRGSSSFSISSPAGTKTKTQFDAIADAINAVRASTLTKPTSESKVLIGAVTTYQTNINTARNECLCNCNYCQCNYCNCNYCQCNYCDCDGDCSC